MNALVVGNWKMHETAEEATLLARAIRDALTPADMRKVDVAVAPPFTALSAVHDVLADSAIALAAQNLFWEDAGAYTGEISAPMLVDLGVRYVIVGHSERRRYFRESDDDVRRKAAAAIAHGLRPIVAVGETNEEREAGVTDARVVAQTRVALDGLSPQQLTQIAIAYEPVWAIGTGRSCEPSEADRVMHLIRSSVAGLESVPLLYGGSVSTANFSSYLQQPNCNGGLIGGASLDAASFVSLVRTAGAV